MAYFEARSMNQTVADGFGSNQYALGVPAIDDVAEAHAFFADEAVGGNLDIVKKHRVGVVVDHQVERLDFQLAFYVAHIHQEHG